MFFQPDRNWKSLPVLVGYEELTPIIEISASLLAYQVDLIGDIQLSFWNGLAHFPSMATIPTDPGPLRKGL